jgi:uncharacterized LabA/DUF88 family protein
LSQEGLVLNPNESRPPFSEPPNGFSGDVALYIDWENIKYSLWNRDGRAPNALTLKEAASAYGRVVVAKAYANWQEAQHQADPNDLYSAGIEPIYVPTRTYNTTDSLKAATRRKNSVDIKLTVDAVDYCLMNPNIQSFVLVTGDGDFVHLVNSLRSRGKQVVVVGCSWSTSWQLTSSADHFIPYDVDVDPLPKLEEGEGQVDSSAIERAFDTLVEVMRDIRREGEPNVFAQIKLMLLSRLGQFDERQHGFAHFKDFMREAEARGLVKTYTVGLIDRAYLPDEQIDLGSPGAEQGMEVAVGAAPPYVLGAVASGGEDEEPPRQPAPLGYSRNGAHQQEQDNSAMLPDLLRFLDDLQRNSQYMSFKFMADRAAESGSVPLSVSEIASLLNTAIESNVFERETKTIWNRATAEYRDINTFKLNRSHPAVMEALGLEPVELEQQG